MANFKVKGGITIGANGITFSDGSTQTQAAASNTTGSSSNTASTLVLRDSAGGFSAGAIIGESFTGNLNASNVSSGTLDNARTTASSSNGASTIVARDAAGSFSANGITVGSNGVVFSDGSSQTSLRPKVNALGSISGAITILLSNGNFVTATATGAVQWSIANTSGGSSFADIVVLELTNGGAGTQTWMTGTKWPSGTAPTLQASGVDVLAFFSDDNGTTWRGVLNMSNSS